MGLRPEIKKGKKEEILASLESDVYEAAYKNLRKFEQYAVIGSTHHLAQNIARFAVLEARNRLDIEGEGSES